jgi:protein-S-isoprenylcysteine O-methyltransferase Ste14
LILGGFILLSSAWRVLHAAQQERRLAISGAYAVVRHPQYVGFILIMLGFLFQWPTLITLLMFPILIVMYVRLARREEGEVRAQFGAMWDAYAAAVPPFFPRLGGRGEHARPAPRAGGQVHRVPERPR